MGVFQEQTKYGMGEGGSTTLTVPLREPSQGA
jgi:hypothetical protein